MRNVNLDLIEQGLWNIGEAIVKLTDSLESCGVEDIEYVRQINEVIYALNNRAEELEEMVG